KDRCRPFEKLVAMLLKARETPGEIAAPFNQRIFRLLLLVETIEQNALAQPISRHDNFLRLHGRDELIEHQRAKRQGLHASARYIWHLGERFRSEPFDHTRNIRCLARRDDILMQHMDRVIALRHVDASETSPDAAHNIEPLALMFPEPLLLAQRSLYHSLRFCEIVVREINKAQRPERKRCSRP